jgi:tRNA(Ile)-lysidine synthase
MGVTLTDDFVKAISRSYQCLHAGHSKLLLAVSGGADSLALLLATHALKDVLALELVVVSVDHGLRSESVLEVAEVEAWARELALPFVGLKLELREGSGLEERARKARYQAFETLRVERGARWTVTAHTATDQAETVLMRLARGTSLTGARGILEQTSTLLRPLLHVDKSDVDTFLKQAGVRTVVKDPHNQDPRFLRARIRRDVFPALVHAAGHDQVAKNVSRFAQLAAEDDEVLMGQARDALSRLRRPGGLDAVGLRALPASLARRVLRQWWDGLGLALDFDTLDHSLTALTETGGATLSQGAQLRTEGGLVRCLLAAEPVDAREGRDVQVQVLESVPPEGPWLGLSELRAPYQVRGRQPGDRVRLGNGRRRKLQDVLVDAKVPREQRDSLSIVTDSRGEVIWVPGVWPKRSNGAFRYYLVLENRGGTSAPILPPL